MDVGVADFGDLAWGGGIGGDLEDAAFFAGDAAGDGAAVLQADDAAFILVGDDLAGIHDVLQKIAQRVAIARTGEIGADSAAFVAKAMTGLTRGGDEQLMTALKVAPALQVLREGDDFIDAVSLAGAFRRMDNSACGDRRFRCRKGGKPGALIHIRHRGERVGADGVEEAVELIATLPRAGAGEPFEELAAQSGGPAVPGKAQAIGKGDLLLVRPCGTAAQEIRAVAVVAGHAIDGKPGNLVILRAAHELESLRNNFR